MKSKRTIFLVGIILTAPFALVCGILLFNSVNPMQLMFITSFTVENQSGQDLWITPIGTYGAKGQKGRLPIYMTTLPALPAIRSGHYRIKNGQSMKIKYDCDDINFSEIAVKTQDNNVYEFVIDSNPSQNQYHSPISNNFVISEIKSLSPARSQIVDVMKIPDRRVMIDIVLFGAGVLFCIFWRSYRKLKNQ